VSAVPIARGWTGAAEGAPQQRHLERVPLRLGQLREDDFVDGSEQVPEGGEGELRLGLRRAARDGTKPRLLAEAHRLPPDGCLADARLAFEDEGDVPATRLRQESLDPRELGAPPDDRSYALSLRADSSDC
jgi:hypothetical protein